jgi:hypothetical protein
MARSPSNDEYSAVLAVKPKHVHRWGRRDAIGRWFGRIVSAKKGYSNIQSTSLLGIVVEVGPAGWLTIMWEDGNINARWNRIEVEILHGPPNWDNFEFLRHHPTAHDEILDRLRTMDRSRLWRDGTIINGLTKAASQGSRPQR